MFGNILILATAFQVGPFYEQRPDFAALRPLWSCEAEKTDVLWPVFTAHADWWRFCWFTHYQETADKGFQFEIIPLWFNGRDGKTGEDYWGLFPLWGSHPHCLLLHDFRFCLWPVWMQYRMPRPKEKRWMTTNAVLFPFVHWRDDGSWGFWPVYGVNHQRASDHRYALWPIVTWADYREDRDSGGAGSSWMVWPLCGSVDREREKQTLIVPPLFSFAKTWSRPWAEAGNSGPELFVRCPWPIFEWQVRNGHSRWSIWPLYEDSTDYKYGTGEQTAHVRRFGWKLVELYDHETRVFPFWVSRDDDRYFRLWPLWESVSDEDGSSRSRFLSIFPIRWVDSVERNWAKYWTFYERERNPVCTCHSLLWGLIRWRTVND